MRTTIVALVLVALGSWPMRAQAPAPPQGGVVSAADFAAIVARQPKDRNGNQTFLQLAPYNVTMEHRVNVPQNASIHDKEAELFYVVDGGGTIVTGGTLIDGMKGRLIKDWTFTGELSTGSGLPLTPIYLMQISGTGVLGAIRAAKTSTAVGDAPDGYFLNPLGYAPPALGQWGDAGRNSVTGPRTFSLDASIARTFRWSDRINIDWRIDASNVLNQVTYSGVNMIVTSSQFGLANRANAGEVRADRAAHVADGVAGVTGRFFRVKEKLPAADVAGGERGEQFFQMRPLLARIRVERGDQFLGLFLHVIGILRQMLAKRIGRDGFDCLGVFERGDETGADGRVGGFFKSGQKPIEFDGAGRSERIG